MDERHGISVALLRPFAEMLGRLEVDPKTFLDELGIVDDAPPNSYVGADKVDRALDAIAERRGEPHFALTLAKTAAVRPLGLFGHLVWLSGTVRDALERAVKFWSVVTRRTTLALIERDGIAIVQQRPVSKTEPRGRILVEFPFASLALRARDATGGVFALRAVRFAHTGETTAAYADVFRAPVSFGARLDEIEMTSEQLDLPLASADPITSKALESSVVKLATESGDRIPFLDRARHAIRENLDGEVSVARIATALGISARTLRRQLDDHGTTLRGLVDDARHARADELLATGASVKEVAFALGFSEPSAFSRAYKRWTGRAPRE
jgi:AraC-like DNA-binding protein